MPFPWDDVITAGLGLLRLSPQNFWAMTLPEIALAVRAVLAPRAAPLARCDLDALIRAYPDRKNAEINDAGRI